MDLTPGSTVRITSGRYHGFEGVVLAVYPRRFLFWRWQIASVRGADGKNFSLLPKILIRTKHLRVLSVPIADSRNTVTVREGDPGSGSVW